MFLLPRRGLIGWTHSLAHEQVRKKKEGLNEMCVINKLVCRVVTIAQQKKRKEKRKKKKPFRFSCLCSATLLLDDGSPFISVQLSPDLPRSAGGDRRDTIAFCDEKTQKKTKTKDKKLFKARISRSDSKCRRADEVIITVKYTTWAAHGAPQGTASATLVMFSPS